MINRREAALALGATLLLGSVAQAAEAADLEKAIAGIERTSGGRLGVAFLDTGSGKRFAWRGDERFPMCSTFKLLLVAAVLARIDDNSERLDRAIPITAADLVPYAPTTGQHVGGTLSVSQLCEAALTLSDNVAANLLLRLVGGPIGLTTFLRRSGDGLTRLDRIEPVLNEALIGDPRDTTSPHAMLDTMRHILLGGILKSASRIILTNWSIANRTGDEQIRAGLPAGWRIGDKTGSGANNTNNDVAIIWPPNRLPWLLTVYMTGAKVDLDARKAVIASVARAVADRFTT